MSQRHLSGRVQTVLGPLDPASLGITLTHEHLLVDLMSYFAPPDEASLRPYADKPVGMDVLSRIGQVWAYNRANLTMHDVATAIEEVTRYKLAGGKSLVDTTNIGLARDPLALARISRATGLNVIMGAGYYVPPSHPPDMDQRSEDSIAEEMIRDVTVGVGDTGVRSGVIGELGNVNSPLGDNERKVLRAAARAQAETGAPISIHPAFGAGSALEIVGVLAEAGADPRNVIMGHQDPISLDGTGLKDLAETGCFIEFDLFGFEDSSFAYLGLTDFTISDVQRIHRAERVLEMGYIDQLLIAQDVCQRWQLTRHGGKGYAHILENIVPRMRKTGISDDQIHTIMVDNPARALTFA